NGVIVASLDRAVIEHGDLVAKHLGALVSDRDKFAAQNTANWFGGGFVYVPANVEVSEPIVISSLQSSGAVHWRSLVVLEQGAKATVTEQYMSVRDEDAYFNPVTE